MSGSVSGSAAVSAIYLDNHSTTPLDPAVLEAMLPYFTRMCGNAHAGEHVFGWQAFAALERARFAVAELIGAEGRDVVFTGGATESAALAITGLAGGNGLARGRDRIITVATEHACVLESCRHMESLGWEVVVLPVGGDGLVDLAALEAQLDERTLLVSMMLGNNEIGVIQPVGEMAAMCREVGCLSHTDATQAVGRMAVDVEELGVDMLSASAHKLYGPKGIGMLYVRDGVAGRLRPLVHGGGQERGLRSGTVAVPLAVGFGEAARIAGDVLEDERARIGGLRDLLLGRLRERLPGIVVLGSMEARLAGNLSLLFPGVAGSSVVAALGERLAVSTGSSCSSVRAEASHVIRALGVGDEVAGAALRVGIGRFNTEGEMERAADMLLAVVCEGG